MEQCAPIWHNSLTQENIEDIERVQKNAFRIILKKYINYEEALETLRIDSLLTRRDKLSLNFALNCKNNEKTKDLFPTNKKTHMMKTRNPAKIQITHATRERTNKSGIPYLQNLINKKDIEEKKTMK